MERRRVARRRAGWQVERLAARPAADMVPRADRRAPDAMNTVIGH
jgi:hypothetical protein